MGSVGLFLSSLFWVRCWALFTCTAPFTIQLIAKDIGPLLRPAWRHRPLQDAQCLALPGPSKQLSWPRLSDWRPQRGRLACLTFTISGGVAGAVSVFRGGSWNIGATEASLRRDSRTVSSWVLMNLMLVTTVGQVAMRNITCKIGTC